MATTLHAPSGASSPSGNPSTPPYPQFPRLHQSSSSSPSIQRNGSTSSTHSNTTTSSTSSLAAVPMRPPPVETRTAATTPSQMGAGADGTSASAMASRAASSSREREGSGGEGPSGMYHSPQPVYGNGTAYGGRGFMRNGPRSEMARHGTSPIPSIHTSSPGHGPTSPLALASSPLKDKSTTLPLPNQLSPTTPRAPSAPWSSSNERDGTSQVYSPDNPPRVMITTSGASSPSDTRGRAGFASIPSSPTQDYGGSKARTLSVGGKSERDLERERRMSQASSGSSSGTKRPSARDWVFGEEIGRGSYSTVVRATPASNAVTQVRSDREYAVKIMNQQHLIAEKKAKYAVIERDALIRLSQPRANSASPSTTTRHVRGASGSSGRRKSNASVAGSAKETSSAKDRLSIAISDSSSGSGPLSPTSTPMHGRRPSRGAEPPAMVVERTDEISERARSPGSVPAMMRSRPPSPVKEESSSQGHEDEEEDESGHKPTSDVSAPTTPAQPNTERFDDTSASTIKGASTGTSQAQGQLREKVSPSSSASPPDAMAIKSSATPKKRRTSLAPSERSVKTVTSRSGMGPAHPGVIRLYSTFNDNMSLYYVLELASNGELLDLIRKNGSLDIESTRYYTAQLIDTIEYIHERDIIHRDLKPENILLDSNMRIKVTDFGSCKILGREDASKQEEKKRSFVGSADFVSPEVLRNEPAVLSSDIWAFGCIVFQLLTGKPPFRGATDYLTFQKILKREFDYPADFDDQAKSLIELVLNPDPTLRPTASDIKSHSFFASIDFGGLWTIPAPTISSGLTRPVAALTSSDSNSDVWAVFDDEVSDGGFEYDDDEVSPDDTDRPKYDQTAAADAVRHIDNHSPNGDLTVPQYPFQDAGSEGDGDLQPPRPSFVDASPNRKWGRGRLGSKGSERTSSSSSTNRHALSGLLESLKLQGGSPSTPNGAASKGGSGRNSRTSDRSGEPRDMQLAQAGSGSQHRAASQSDTGKWSSLLLAGENIIYTSSILVRPPTSIHLPSFLMPAPKRRQLILTDFPRLFTVKEDVSPPSLSVKSECVFVANSQPRKGISRGEVNARVEQGAAGWVLDVQDKGPKGFTVQTTTQLHNYTTDTPELKKEWMTVLKRILT